MCNTLHGGIVIRKKKRKKLLTHRLLVNKHQQRLENPVQGKWMLANSPDRYWFSSYRFYETGIDEFGFLTHYMEEY